LRRQADELNATPKPRLITDYGAGSNRHAHIRQSQFDRDLLARRQFSRDHGAKAGFGNIGAASG
jgi:hypothetical protein